MAALTKLSKPASLYRMVTLWVVVILLVLQLLAVVSTWQCSGPSHRASQAKPPFSSLLSWLSGQSLCEGEAEGIAFPFEGALRHGNSVRRQRPYAYAFCLTSVHHLCTALINTVRLRKLQSFEVTHYPRHLLLAVMTSNMHGESASSTHAIAGLGSLHVIQDITDTAWYASSTTCCAIQSPVHKLTPAVSSSKKEGLFQCLVSELQRLSRL